MKTSSINIGSSAINIRASESILPFLLSQLLGVLSVLLLTANTAVCIWPLFLTAFLKLLIPVQVWRKACSIIANSIAETWISINNFSLNITRKITWDVHGLEGLSLKEWYLVISNHQTWADIVVLQKIFNRRIPLLKFFLKKELIWVPLLGLAWWALEFPFMKRYSEAYLKKHPGMRGKDIEITRKACEKFKTIPVSVMNFVEGTRFTREKRARQDSPFRHLLKPKAGGIGFVLSAMGEQLETLLNITIIYPQGETSFWAFLCGRISEVKIYVEKIAIKDVIKGDYITDPHYKTIFQKWLNSLWLEKDKLFDSAAGNNN